MDKIPSQDDARERQVTIAANAELERLQDAYDQDRREIIRRQDQERRDEENERIRREQERARITQELDHQDEINWDKAQQDLREQLPRLRQRATERVAAEDAAAERQLRRLLHRAERIYQENQRFVHDIFGWRAGKRKTHHDRIRPLEDEEQGLIQARADNVREKELADLARKFQHDMTLNNIRFHSDDVQRDTDRENQQYNHRKDQIDSDFDFEWTYSWKRHIADIHDRIKRAEQEIEHTYKDKLRLIRVKRRRRGQASLALDIGDAPEHVADDTYIDIIESNETPDKPRNKARENVRATHNFIRKMVGALPWIERIVLGTVISVNPRSHRCAVRTAGAIAVGGDPEASSRPMILNNVKFGFHPPRKNKEYVVRIPGAYRDSEVSYPPGLPWIKVPGSGRLVYQASNGVVAGPWPPDQETPPEPTILITHDELAREFFIGVDGKDNVWTQGFNGSSRTLRKWPDLGAGGRDESTEYIVPSDRVDSILAVDNSPGSDAILGQQTLTIPDAILIPSWREYYHSPGWMVLQTHGGGVHQPSLSCCEQGLSPGINSGGFFDHTHADDTVPPHNHYGYIPLPTENSGMQPDPSTRTASYMIYLVAHGGEEWDEIGRVDTSVYPLQRETFYYNGFEGAQAEGLSGGEGLLDEPNNTNMEHNVERPVDAYVASAIACGGCGRIIHGWTSWHDYRTHGMKVFSELIDDPHIWSEPSEDGTAGFAQGPAYVAVDDPEAYAGHSFFRTDPIPYNPLTDFGRVLSQGWDVDNVRSSKHLDVLAGETRVAGTGHHPVWVMAMGLGGSMVMWADDQSGRTTTIYYVTQKAEGTRPSTASRIYAQTYDLGNMLQYMNNHHPIPWEYTIDYGQTWLEAKADPFQGASAFIASILPDDVSV